MAPEIERAGNVLKELEERAKLLHEELMKRIEQKQAEFADMLTMEGAAHLVAKDLGIKLLDGEVKKLEMKNIVAGMHSVNAIGKIFKISGIVDFSRGGKPGKVVNLFIGDSTSYVRLPLWNEQTKLVEDEEIKVGDVVQIMNALAREGMFGIELSLGKYGRIAQLEESEEEMQIDLPDVDELARRYLSPDARRERVAIKDAIPGNFETRAFIVQVFKSSFIFNICPECGGKVSTAQESEAGAAQEGRVDAAQEGEAGKESESDKENEADRYTCSMHGEVEPEPALVISAVADDGTGSLRVTFFRSAAEQLCGMTAQEIAKISKDERYVAVAEKILGKEFVLEGRVRKNQQFDRTEMIVNSIKQIDISGETEKLIGALELKVGA